MQDYNRTYQIDYFYGWRYVFSAEFRSQVKLKWKNNWLFRVLSIPGGLMSMLVSLSVLAIFFITIGSLLVL